MTERRIIDSFRSHTLSYDKSSYYYTVSTFICAGLIRIGNMYAPIYIANLAIKIGATGRVPFLCS